MKATGKFVLVGEQTYQIWTSHYPSSGTLAIVLGKGRGLADQETAIVFSVNLDHGQDHESKDLPPNCFYVPEWRQEIRDVIPACIASGHLKQRMDLPRGPTGYETAIPWEFVS